MNDLVRLQQELTIEQLEDLVTEHAAIPMYLDAAMDKAAEVAGVIELLSSEKYMLEDIRYYFQIVKSMNGKTPTEFAIWFEHPERDDTLGHIKIRADEEGKLTTVYHVAIDMPV